MEHFNESKRSQLWEEIYAILDQLNIQHSECDDIDKPSAATQIEQAARKHILKSELITDAEDFLTVIKTWNDKEMLGGAKGHKLVNMRPILLAKNICKNILRKK